MLATFENNLSIICASLPVMQPMFKILPQVMKSVFSQSSANHSSDRLAIRSFKGKNKPRSRSLEHMRFDRLDSHGYPLSSTQVSIEGTTVIAEQTTHAIAVQREWEVSSV